MRLGLLIWLLIHGCYATAQIADGRIVDGNIFPGVKVDKNYVQNSQANQNIRLITASTHTVARSTTTPIMGVADFEITASGAGITTWTTLSLESSMNGQNCEFSGIVEGGGASWTAVVRVGSDTVASLALPSSSTPVPFILNTTCSTSAATTVGFSTTGSAPVLNVDELYFGRATNLGSGAIITNWQDYNLVIGATTTAPTLGTTTINRAQWRRVGGDMEIRYDLRKTTGGTAGNGVYLFPIPSGFTVDTNRLPVRPGGTAELTTVGNGKISATNDSGGVTTAPLTVLYSHSFPNNVYLNYIVGPSVEQTQTVNSASYPATTNPWSISFIAKVPIQGWDGNGNVFRADTIGWKVDANISGANASLGVSDVTTYTEITNTTLTLTNNPGLGNIPAQIPCTGTNPSTGTTCSVNESVGVVFNLPAAGDVLACASFSHFMNTGAGGSIDVVFQIVETPNNAQTILQEGKSRVNSNNLIPSTGIAAPHRLCGTFSFASAGQKTLRLMYEQDNAGTINNNLVFADASSALGQRDIHWEVYPLNQVVPAPLIANSVVTTLQSPLRIEHFKFGGASENTNCTASPCTIHRQSGGISSVTRSATGSYTVNFSPAFSATPNCIGSAVNAGASIAIVNSVDVTPISGSSYRFNIANTSSALVDGTAIITCWGNN